MLGPGLHALWTGYRRVRVEVLDIAATQPRLVHAQLDAILRRETMGARFQRHVAMRDLTIRKTSTYAKLASDPKHASATVTALAPVKDPELIRSEMKKRGFTLGGGYGDWKATTFRIGHMGDIPLASLETMLDVLTEVART